MFCISSFAATAESVVLFTHCKSLLCSATNKFACPSIEPVLGVRKPFFIVSVLLFIRCQQLYFIYAVLSMYKQCWVNCTLHSQLKQASHLFKARFSGKVGSCFLKVRAASLVHPRMVTQVLLDYLTCNLFFEMSKH